MAITLTPINPSDPMSAGPQTLNNNFTAIKQHIDDIEALLNPSSNTLKLTNILTIPNGSIEASTFAASAATGIVFLVNPNATGVTMSITAEGDISARKIDLTGTGTEKSTIADLDINGALNINGNTVVGGLVSFTGTNARVAHKYSVIGIVDGNIGAAATNTVDISKEHIVYLDYNNGAAALSGDADVKLDTTNFANGQIFKLYCFRKNANAMRLHNGGVGTEVFAYIDPNGAGYTTISSTTKPQFDVQVSPNNQSFIEVQWTNIGAGTYRLVVLDSKNIIGVV
jgi:hypothetical protein